MRVSVYVFLIFKLRQIGVSLGGCYSEFLAFIKQLVKVKANI